MLGVSCRRALLRTITGLLIEDNLVGDTPAWAAVEDKVEHKVGPWVAPPRVEDNNEVGPRGLLPRRRGCKFTFETNGLKGMYFQCF